ncbi:MAG: type pantothenate kinase [Solirubrobacterales bacterium]|nr:type pantothenate kinase [Solirubrobacterales bacterium]MDX6652404.1 type pantothenate kinase [Solirubrobacterales bacterium]MDX6662247.1 type pantothenate kinase [Solirubrobacterales bacterium]
MLLAVDVGNTQTHVGVFDGAELDEHWRFATEPQATADELAVQIGNLLSLRKRELEAVSAIIVSCVVPALAPEYTGMADRYLHAPCEIVGPALKTGMPIKMDNPHELGADRLVNAVAAYERFGEACVVVDFGTAITFDAVSDEGEYLGGVIGPGVEISMAALTERAAKLPKVDLVEPEAVIGKTTAQSIQAGIVYGFAGAIDAIARRIEAELGEGVAFIATGGLASSIVPFCETIDEIDDLLTLTGLRLIHDRNA